MRTTSCSTPRDNNNNNNNNIQHEGERVRGRFIVVFVVGNTQLRKSKTSGKNATRPRHTVTQGDFQSAGVATNTVKAKRGKDLFQQDIFFSHRRAQCVYAVRNKFYVFLPSDTRRFVLKHISVHCRSYVIFFSQIPARTICVMFE